ncbi:MAG: SRPBCC family protein [Acidobacteriota bacterium]
MMKSPGRLVVESLGEREIRITRVFDAPRRLVFEAHTKPELLKRWLGVRGGWELAVCEIELRAGGVYRYVWRKVAKGIDMGMGGMFREIDEPSRIVCTERFDDPWYPGECLNTTEFVERGGETTLTLTLLYESAAARDGVLQSGMERGLGESYDVLAELLKVPA